VLYNSVPPTSAAAQAAALRAAQAKLEALKQQPVATGQHAPLLGVQVR